MTLRDVITKRIRAAGPLPFAAFMDLALYHPELGYYARARRRSGRAGDFFTSVDAGPLFGELLAAQFAEMWRLAAPDGGEPPAPFDLVEAGAGSGRLARGVLDHAAAAHAAFYQALRLTLVERSPTARAAHNATLGPHAGRLVQSGVALPARVEGIIYANELLDALPVHSLVMTAAGLREVYVDSREGRLVESLGPVSPAARAHVERCGIRLEPGWRTEVCPAAVSWVTDAARRLERGFLLLIDYGHEAHELYSPTHAHGTLACYRRHRVEVAGDGRTATPWLEEPGTRDITAHVDLTAIRTTAEQAGLQTLGTVDQTYFLLGLAAQHDTLSGPVSGAAETHDHLDPIRRRLALKTLLVPGGLGSTHKVLIFGKQVGTPSLQGCSFSRRMT